MSTKETTTTDQPIPDNPEENLKRLQSICKHWEDSKEVFLSKLQRAQDRLEGINEKLESMNNNGQTDSKEYRQVLSIRDRFLYDVDNYSKRLRTLKGQIQWAKRIQIPYLQLKAGLDEDEKPAAGEA